MDKKSDPRFAAYDILGKTEEKNGFLNIVLPSMLKRYSLAEKDRALCAAIVKGVYERDRTLSFVIEQLSAFPVEKIDKRIMILLKTGVYQILFMDKIPPFAVCNETVRIASEICGKKATGFLNGMLRNAVRKKEELKKKIAEAPEAVRLSVSDDVYGMFSSQYGEETAIRILTRFNEIQPLCLRVNTLAADRKALAGELASKGLTVKECGSCGIAVYGNSEKVISEMDSSGKYYIQGFSSQAAVETLDVKEGDRVIDMCACPGGKSLGAAINMKNKGSVTSFDIHESKLELISSAAERLGIDIIKTCCADSTKRTEELIRSADRVICDVPCSGTGSIGKRTEIRYKTADELYALTGTQYRILSNGISYLKPNGKLVYSVCSLNKAEGEMLIKKYTEENTDAILLSERTILPENDGYDGFYIAVLQKR